MLRSACIRLTGHVLLLLLLSGQAFAWTAGLKDAADAFALGKATPAQEMMVFVHNKEVNLLAQEGKISMSTYRDCQEEFFRLNEDFASKAVRDAGFDPSISNRKYNPGTDTDVNVLGKGGRKVTLDDVKKIDGNYQRIVKEHFQRKGLKPPANAVNTETDFMPHPQHTDPDEFQRIVRHINQNGGTAYTDPRAAAAQSKLGTTSPMSIDEVSSFSSTMKDMADTKIAKANALRAEARSVRGSNPGRAEYLEAQARQFDYQAAKYHNRIAAANNHVRKQNGLPEKPRNITGFDQSADIIEISGRNPFTGKDASTIHNLHQSALQSSTDDMIDTLVEIARQNPSKAAQIQKALGKEISRLPANRAGQAIERIENATKGVKGLDGSLVKGAVAEARLMKQAGTASTKWASFKQRMKNVSGFNRMTKFSVVMTAGGAVLMAHQGISITLDNVKATDTLWDYFRNCYYHAAWEGTGIGPAFEQAQREEIERYMKEFEQGQSPSMVKHVTFTMLKTGVYMGRDAIIGVLYLPDTVWEYFTQEKELEGYAAMQNELARVMRQMVQDRKGFEQVMANMKKMGLQNADAKPFLDCLCAGCGGSLGGFFNPACTSDIGHGPCQCNGPLTIWKTPLPAGNKEAQYDCFNKVAKMRYNEARAIFDSWRQQMVKENAKSVQPELDAIRQDIVNRKALEEEQTARDISDRFAAISDLLLPQDADYVRAMVGPYLQNHAMRNLETGDVDRALDNLDRAQNKIGARSAQQKSDMAQRRIKYEKWAEKWRETKDKKFREIDELVRNRQTQKARGEIEVLEYKMLKDPTRSLPPAVKDPQYLALKERVADLGRRYEQAMADMWARVKPLGPEREHRQAIPILEKALEDWEHPHHAEEGLERQLGYHRAEVKRAEDRKKAGQHYEKNKELARAVHEYEESLRIQKDSALERDLARLRSVAQKQVRAGELWNEAQRLQQGQSYPEAIRKYREGLAIWTDPAIQKKVADLEKYLAERKKQEAARAGQTVQSGATKTGRTATGKSPSAEPAVAPATGIGQMAGTWNIDANGYKGRVEFQAAGNQLSGRLWLDGHKKWETLRDVRFDGRTLSFIRPITSMDQQYTGQLNGQEIAGTFQQGGKGSYRWKIWRGKVEDAENNASLTASQINMLGEWNHEGNGHRTKLIVKEQKGKFFSGFMHGNPLINGVIDGSAVSFTRDIPLRQEYTGTITVKPDGAMTMSGTFTQKGTTTVYKWSSSKSAPQKDIETPGHQASPSVTPIPAGNKAGQSAAASAGWKAVSIGNVNFAVPASWQYETRDEPDVEKLHLYWDGSFDAPVHGVSGGVTADFDRARSDLSGSRAVRLGGVEVLRADEGPAMNLLFPPMSGNRAVALVVFRGPDGDQATIDAVLATIRVGGQGGADAQQAASPQVSLEVGNIYGVQNGPTRPTVVTLNSPRTLALITNYHWNNAGGATPGTIALRDSQGKMYGPWKAEGSPGQGGVPNAYWTVRPMVLLPAGTYTVVDSDPATWASNPQSGGQGFTRVETLPPSGRGDTPAVPSTGSASEKGGPAGPGGAVAASVSALVGTWNINANGYAGKIEFRQAGGGLTGRLWLDAHSVWEELRDVSFDGFKLSFTRPIPSLDQRYTGVLSDGEVRGTFDQAGGGTYKWWMKRGPM
jgi:tetratricopeptide (TPR) repeat protein